ncbi:MAG: hypothetical protein KGS72_20180 [Cyanobacteria bacterium REEB67]|nr:hypothetical protein [Cyanobacteria bacterium REEB67]
MERFKRVYLAPISNGLGDLICSLPVLQSLIASGRETYLVRRSTAQQGFDERIDGLAGSIDENELEQISAGASVQVINLRDHPLQTDHIWGSPEFLQKYPQLYIDEIIRRIAADKGVDIDGLSCRPLLSKKVQALTGKIAFIPGSRGLQKCWPASHWLTLAQLLRERRGFECRVIGEPDQSPIVKELLAAGLIWHPTPTIGEALDALSSVRAVVGVDTGAMHMAVQQLVPTVALFRYNALFARQKAYVRSLLAPTCDRACLALEFASVGNKIVSYKTSDIQAKSEAEKTSEFYWETWKCQMPPAQHCMTGISAEAVYENLLQLSSTAAT